MPELDDAEIARRREAERRVDAAVAIRALLGRRGLQTQFDFRLNVRLFTINIVSFW